MAGRKKKAPTPRGNPRLKACSKCQVLNAPRTFFCKECNHPFYSEEYMAGRLDRKRSDPEESELSSVPPTPSIVEPDFFQVDEFVHRMKMIPELFSSYILSSKQRSTINFDLLLGQSDSTKPISIPELAHYSIDQHFPDSSLIAKESYFINFGAPIDSVSFNPTNTCLVALASNHKFIFWDLIKNQSFGSFESTECIKSVSFCSNFASPDIVGILAVVKTDRIELVLIENPPISLRVIYSTFTIFKDPIFPTDVDCRFFNNSIELLISNNLSSFVHFLRIEDNLCPSSFRSFGYNHVVNKVNIDDASSSIVQSTCVCFLRSSANFFLVGYSAGTVCLWDVRNTSSPVQIITNTAGTRRYLNSVKSSWISPQTAFAAFQAGSIIDLDPTDDSGEIISIGGEIRNAQCFGIDCVGTRAFAAMSSGVVITIDTSLRGKLRRPLTSYVCQWEAEEEESATQASMDSTSGASLEEKLISKIMAKKSNEKLIVKLFNPKKIPNNLKLLKASDGASNEGFAKLRDSENSRSVPIRTIVSSSDGLVAYGNDAGIVHIFRP